MKWMDLPQDRRDDLRRRRELNRALKKADTAGKRRQRQIAKGHKLKGSKKPRVKLDFQNVSRQTVDTVALAEHCRHMSHALASLQGDTEKRRPNQREAFEAAVKYWHVYLRRELLQRMDEKPHLTESIGLVLETPIKHSNRKLPIERSVSSGNETYDRFKSVTGDDLRRYLEK